MQSASDPSLPAAARIFAGAAGAAGAYSTPGGADMPAGLRILRRPGTAGGTDGFNLPGAMNATNSSMSGGTGPLSPPMSGSQTAGTGNTDSTRSLQAFSPEALFHRLAAASGRSGAVPPLSASVRELVPCRSSEEPATPATPATPAASSGPETGASLVSPAAALGGGVVAWTPHASSGPSARGVLEALSPTAGEDSSRRASLHAPLPAVVAESPERRKASLDLAEGEAGAGHSKGAGRRSGSKPLLRVNTGTL